MKKIIFLFFVLGLATSCFCQQQPSQNLSVTPSDYLQKSKRQKKTGFILLGGGAALVVIGAVIPQGEPTGDINWIAWSEEHKNDGIKGAFISVGLLSMLGSVPFFIVSGKNKRRANTVSVSIKSENTSFIQNYKLAKVNYPSLAFKIAFN